jgi:hypothetical protein
LDLLVQFADWLRGTPKLKCGTSEEWDAWTEQAKTAHPIRWWIAEEGLDHLQKFVYYIPDRLNDIRYYINNRWITRSHALTAHPRDIAPGTWRDVGNRFLPCLFNELVDFVEIEQAWHHCIWSDDAKTKFNVPWYRKGWLRLRTWRCSEAGMEYLRWAETLTNEEFLEEGEKHKAEPTYQAKAAKEIIRACTPGGLLLIAIVPDPCMDASGWSAHCEAMRVKYPGSMFSSLNSKDPADRKASDKAHKLLTKIEKAYEKEDEEMMIRLIKIRESLWT